MSKRTRNDEKPKKKSRPEKEEKHEKKSRPEKHEKKGKPEKKGGGSSMSERLREKLQHDIDNKGQRRGSRKGVFDFSDYEDVEFYAAHKKRNLLDIIPYIIQTKKHPENKDGSITGQPDHKLTIAVHRWVGASESNIICLKENYGKACPICEEVELLKKNGADDEAIDEIKAKWRTFYNVIDLLEDDEVIKIFEVSEYKFGQDLQDEAEEGDDEGKLIVFSDPTNGMSVEFRGKESTFKNRKFIDIRSIGFAERENQYDEDIVEKAYPLDSLLNVLTYDEIRDLYYGTDDDADDSDDDDDDKVSRKKKHHSKKDDDSDDDDDDSDDDDDDDSDDDLPKKKHHSKKYDDDDDDSDDDNDPDDSDDADDSDDDNDGDSDDDSDDDDLPKKKHHSKKYDDDDDDDDVDYDADRPSKKKGKAKALKCPEGYKFGKDCDKKKECKDCDIWDECSDAHDA